MSNKVTKEQLQKMYVDEDMSSKQIGEILGFPPSKIYAECHKYGLKKIGKKYSNQNTPDNPCFSRKQIYENYIIRNLSPAEVAKKLDADINIITQLIEEYHIKKPDGSYSKGNCPSKEELEKEFCENNLNVRKLANKYGVSRMTIYNWLKQQGLDTLREKRNDADLLEKLVVENNLSLNEIAKELKCSSVITKEKLENAGYEFYLSIS